IALWILIPIADRHTSSRSVTFRLCIVLAGTGILASAIILVFSTDVIPTIRLDLGTPNGAFLNILSLIGALLGVLAALYGTSGLLKDPRSFLRVSTVGLTLGLPLIVAFGIGGVLLSPVICRQTFCTNQDLDLQLHLGGAVYFGLVGVFGGWVFGMLIAIFEL